MSYQIEFIVLGGLLGTFVLMIIAPFAMLAVAIVLVVVAAAVLALIAGILVAPFYAVRAVRRRWAGHHGDHDVEEPAYAAGRATVGSAL